MIGPTFLNKKEKNFLLRVKPITFAIIKKKYTKIASIKYFTDFIIKGLKSDS